MSMTKYECAVDHFAQQMDLSLEGMPALEALNAGGEAIDLLFALRYDTWADRDNLIAVVDNLLEEWG
jgi:hypothetical protein